jgi:hypothetical protein
MTRAALAAALVLAAPLARAADPADGATELEVAVGDALNLCQAGLARCPVQLAACDDPKVAVIVTGAAGPELRGAAPGKTLCSTNSLGSRRLFRVTVKRAAEKKGGEEKKRAEAGEG